MNLEKPLNTISTLKIENEDDFLSPKNFPHFPKNWTLYSESMLSFDGTKKLNSFILESKHQRTKKILFVVHGLGEHGSRYFHFPHYLDQSIDLIVILELQGHGRSEGQRGHVDHFDDFNKDLLMWVELWKSRCKEFFDGAKIILFGHSMGGLIVLRQLLGKQNLDFCCAIVSAPALGAKVEVPKIKKILAKNLVSIIGRVPLASGISSKYLSHDAAVVQLYDQDPFVYKKVTPKLFVSILKAMDEVNESTEELTVPTLFLSPMTDLIVDAEKTITFYQKQKKMESKHQIRKYPEFYHESFNEVGKEKIFEDINQWISSNCN